MKKSYLALGLVAAVAMSSCSNDEPIPGGNQPGVAEGYVPVELSLTNSAADVDVRDARTRGTGTVGGLTPETNKWQFEDIYVLMTSRDTASLEEEDFTVEGVKQAEGWGFTSVRGDGPFLKRQFVGQFWARPTAGGYNEDEQKNEPTGLNYFIDKNEWWNEAPINKYYPMKGASEFFAYYVDDACDLREASEHNDDHECVTSDMLYERDQDGNYQEAAHAYPIITKENNQMSIQYMIDGTQDLMFGHDNNGGDGYSAKTARAGKIPSITMQHLLTRLTFNVIKGAESTDMVRLNGIQVKSKNQGKMIVAYKSEPENILVWNEEAEDATFSLKQKDSKIFVDDNNVCLDAFGNAIQILADVYVVDENDVDQDEDITELVKADTRALRDVVYTGEDENGNLKFSYNDGRFYASINPGANVSVEDYNNMLEALSYKAPTPTLANGKSVLVDFAPIALSTIAAVGDDLNVGEAMFVKPGVTELKMELDLTMTVRKEGETFPGVEDEYNSSKLEEHLVLPLTIKTPANMIFEQGKSYQINITVYGLEKVMINVVPEAWVNGGHIDIGGDDDAEFGTWFDADGNEITGEDEQPTPDDPEQEEPGDNSEDIEIGEGEGNAP